MPITHKIAAVGGNAVPTAGEIAAVWRRGRRAHGEGKIAAFGGGGAGVHRREQKGTGNHMVSCPLLTPLTFLCAATPFGRAAKRGLRGLGSVRLSAYVQLSCPEFTLRSSPRITVRGQTVQGGGVLLRKAPLRSRVVPWSTKRHCGPLAFRRATEGSRGLKEGLGESRGGKGTIRCPCPLLSPPGDPGNSPAAGRRQFPPVNTGNPSAVGTASPLSAGSSRAQIWMVHIAVGEMF